MFTQNKIVLLSATLLMTSPLTAQAGLSNWLNDTSDWTSVKRSSTSYVIADNKEGDSDATFATSNPNGVNYSKSTGASGGQKYDAESVYLEIDNNTLYVAIVTGLSPTSSDWKAGDIFFDLNDDVGSTVFNNNTSSYAADSHGVINASSGDGYEYGMVVVNHGGDADNSPFVDGNSWQSNELYNVTQWNLGSVSQFEDELHPVSGNTGTKLDDVTSTLSYGASTDLPGHYIIEASISLIGNAFGDSLLESARNGSDINVHWNPLCNNDWIQFTGSIASGPGNPNNPGSIPEPATFALLAIGFVGMAGRRKRKQ